MSEYVYNDEDNVPMNQEAFDADGHNTTVYTSYAEMKAMDNPLPFTDPEPKRCCDNCHHYDKKRYCTKDWNNMDPSYCVPERDEVEGTDCCDDWEWDWEDEY